MTPDIPAPITATRNGRSGSTSSLCQCGARGLTYEGALRRKVRLDLLSWGDLRRNAEALIAADSDDDDSCLLQ